MSLYFELPFSFSQKKLSSFWVFFVLSSIRLAPHFFTSLLLPHKPLLQFFFLHLSFPKYSSSLISKSFNLSLISYLFLRTSIFFSEIRLSGQYRFILTSFLLKKVCIFHFFLCTHSICLTILHWAVCFLKNLIVKVI